MEMKFDGDIIITDPCYLSANMENSLREYEWTKMTRSGIKGIESNTEYGDWSCTTFDRATHEPIGEFCADAGLVCVCDLESVLKFNPKFDYHIERPWTTTWIKNFNGTVQIKRNKNKDSEWFPYYITIEGKGFNKETGEPIEFFTRQTGL